MTPTVRVLITLIPLLFVFFMIAGMTGCLRS